MVFGVHYTDASPAKDEQEPCQLARHASRDF